MESENRRKVENSGESSSAAPFGTDNIIPLHLRRKRKSSDRKPYEAPLHHLIHSYNLPHHILHLHNIFHLHLHLHNKFHLYHILYLQKSTPYHSGGRSHDLGQLVVPFERTSILRGRGFKSPYESAHGWLGAPYTMVYHHISLGVYRD